MSILRIPVILAISANIILASCGSSQGPKPSDVADAGQACTSIEARLLQDPGERPFTAILAAECHKALAGSTSGEDVIASWYGANYLRHMVHLEQIVSTLDYNPNQWSEYLIAREIGVANALDLWITSSSIAELRRKNEIQQPVESFS